jgi:hypothetical protein
MIIEIPLRLKKTKKQKERDRYGTKIGLLIF